MSRVIVTGGAGYVGSVLCPMLLEAGHHVKVIDSCVFRQNPLIGLFHSKNFFFQKKDIRQLTSEDVEGSDYIIHLAAVVGEPSCRKDPKMCYDVNEEATRHLLSLCGNQKFLFASTGSVYGKVEGTCTEEIPTRPLGDYGKSKLKGEELIKQSGLQHVIYRFATAFGGSSRMRFDLLVNDFVYKAMKHGGIVIYEPKSYRTFVHTRDMAKSFVHAIDNFEDMKNGIYNVGTEGNNMEKGEVAKLIKKKVNFRLAFADYMEDPDQRDYYVSYQKINESGFEPEMSVEDGIDEVIKIVDSLEVYNPFNL